MNIENWHRVTPEWHNAVVRACYLRRGFEAEETEHTVRLCESAARNGIRTHNAIKALHLEELFGSKAGGCVPGAKITKVPSRFPATEVWNANRKLGPAVAYEAMAVCMKLAEQFGTGMVSVDSAFHYIWGGSYVLEAAERGYLAYTNCTSLLAEVVPYGGKVPALGTNPHSWAFPTTDSIGFPVLVDWATSAISMGRVQQLAREGQPLPENTAIDANGEMTLDASRVTGLLPFGDHKGYTLGLINELMAGIIGGYRPTLRGRPTPAGEKNTCCFHFVAVHPEALSSGEYYGAKDWVQNVRHVLDDILAENGQARIPGANAARWRERSRTEGGLLFSSAEIEALNELAREGGVDSWKIE